VEVAGVSFKSREKRRRRNLGDKLASAVARRNRTKDTARRWFLTIAKRPGRFDCCRQTFKRGDAIVFRYEPGAIRCQRCAERDPESKGYGPSIRWERNQRVAQ
jgi:hypothetical protein